ncbi:MAG: hypothetical protein JJU40_06200 [Rhodobacteraceae bacterium]|nr:hypothetical protein [Paracoccaceae bacterium]
MSVSTAPLRRFLAEMTDLVEQAESDEPRLLSEGQALLSRLVASDTWLPDRFATSGTDSYRQYLLYCDPKERFCVVSFVWGPGQSTPVHDHTVWGLVGMLRGSERSEAFEHTSEGLVPGPVDILVAGQVVAVSPRIGDVHRVSNAETDRDSISIHVYGANIGMIERHVFEDDGTVRPFVSGYSSDLLPNLWGQPA